MTRSILFSGLLCFAGCGLVDSLTPDPPPIPGDYPQLGEYDDSRIDVVVDGTPLDATGYCSYDDSGIDETKLRFDLHADFLDISTRARDVGEYSSRADEVEASWYESEEFASGPGCGESIVNFDGEKGYDGLTDDAVATWGTLQLVLCNEAGDRIEVSGKFSCALD